MRLPVGVAAILLSSSVAYAQAPGDYYEQGPSQAPGASAPVAQPPSSYSCGTSGSAPELSRRWSVGLAFGSAAIAPPHNPEAKAEFAIASLAIRYRATRSLELEASFAGGREQLEDGMGERIDGDRELSSATLALRYRFRPEAAWNWYVMAGLGATAVTRHDASDEERDAASKPHGQLGVGIERRFRRFALSAELRMTSIGERKDREPSYATPEPQIDPAPSPMDPKGGAVPTEPYVNPTSTSPDRLKGGQFTVGMSYYF